MELESSLPAVRRKFALPIIAVLSLCCINSYDGDFVFDDSEAIVNNDDVRHTPFADVFQNDFWGTKLSNNKSHKSYRPLTILSFRLHFLLKNRLDAMDFHIVNIFLHAIICILSYNVFHILMERKNEKAAFYASALFAVHPVHTEAVSGIVGRAELLCALFTWISILLYDKSVRTKTLFAQWMTMCFSLLCVTIAMFCKETGIATIGIFAVYDIVIINKIYPIDTVFFTNTKVSFTELKRKILMRKSLFVRLIVLIVTASLLLLVRFSIMGFTVPTFQETDNPASFMENPILRIVNYNYIYCLNFWILLCPEWLCFDWSMGCISLISDFDIRLMSVFLLWFCLGMYLMYTFSGAKNEYLRFTVMGIALLVIPFLPASNILFKVGFVLAERTLYIPSAGYCLLFAIGLQRLSSRFAISKIIFLFYVVLVIIYFSRSWKRSNDWRKERTLFYSGLKVCPHNAKVHYNIAKNAADSGNVSYAKLEYEEALRLNPRYAQAMNNLGNLLKDQGKFVEAETYLKRAVELQDDFAAAWMNLGIVLSALGKYDESEKSYFTSLAKRTRYPDCYYNLGILYLQRKEYDKALKAWAKAIHLKRAHRRAWTNTILLLDELGNGEKALATAQQALEIFPDNAYIFFYIANIHGKSGNFTEAEVYFQKAIAKDPANPTFYTNFGVLYHRWNRLHEAEELYRKALSINPYLRSARTNLKKLKSTKGG